MESGSRRGDNSGLLQHVAAITMRRCRGWPVTRPSVIEQYWYAFDWDVEALWNLDLPAEQFPISRLEWHLDVPLWPHENQAYRISPRDVLKSPYRYAVEYRRAHEASLVFPIEITLFRNRWLILDGIHRLLKAHELGQQNIMVRKVPTDYLDGVAGHP